MIEAPTPPRSRTRPRTGRVSAYRLLADQLRESIRTNELDDTHRLPTEAELIARHRLSRQTVRRAYLELVSEGIVERIPGKGTFPARRGLYKRSFSSIDELLALALDTELEVIEPLSVQIDPEVALLLGLQFDEVLHVGYRRLHQGLPFCYTDVYLGPRMEEHLQAAPFLKQKLARSHSTVLGLLDQVLPYPIVGAKQIITAVPAPTTVAIQLGCREAEPMLRIERIHFDADGRPIERCVNYFHPDRYAYRLQLHRQPVAGRLT